MFSWAGVMTQVVQCLPSKHYGPELNPQTAKKFKKKFIYMPIKLDIVLTSLITKHSTHTNFITSEDRRFLLLGKKSKTCVIA
jgi:hypothetical protein